MRTHFPRRSLLAGTALSLAAAACGGLPRAATANDVSRPAFRIRRPDRDFPDSLLLPGEHERTATGYLPPHPSVLYGKARLLLEARNDGSDLWPLMEATPPLDLARHLSPEQVGILRAALRCAGPDAEPERIRPFALYFAVVEAGLLAERGRCPGLPPPRTTPGAPPRQPLIGGDAWLAALARRMRIPVGAVESFADNYRSFSRIPDEVFLRLLRTCLEPDPTQEELARAEAADKALERARTADDLDGLREAALDVFSAGDPVGRAAFARHALDERNALMAERLAPVLMKEGTLVALGAAHVGGPTGVPALLRQRGLRVEPVRVAVYVPPQR